MGKLTMLDVLMAEAVSGVKEVKGSESNPRIMEYLDTTTIRATDDITPWCSACLNWVAIKAGHVGTDSAASATWRTWGAELKKPTRGCVIGFVRNDGSGHVGLFMDEDDTTYSILGGNQADSIKVSRFKKSKEDRDWYFRKAKTPLNSKGVAAAIVGIGSTGALEYGDVIAEFAASKVRIDELTTQVEALNVPQVTSVFEQAMPFLIMGMFAFLMYDRIVGFIRKYGH